MIWRRARDDDRRDEPPKAVPEPVVRSIPLEERGFRQALERTDALADARERARAVLTTIREFLGQIEDAELIRNSSALQARLAAAAVEFPDEAVRVLADVSWRGDIDDDIARGVFGRWMRAPDPDTFAATWGPALGLLTQSNALCATVAEAVREPNSQVSARFRELLRARLVQMVDEQFEKYEFGGANSPVWQLLYALGPANRAEWFCVLGDLAAERGDDRAATHRYEVADRFGGTGIDQRRARLHDITAYQRLRGGTTTADALKGPGTPSEFRHLVLGAAAVLRGSDAETHLSAADRASDSPLRATARLLSALDLLRRGHEDAARHQLDLVLDAPLRTRTDPDIKANAELVRGMLDGDDQAVANAMRLLVARHGADWPSRSLVAPEAVLTAVSRGDHALLPELLAASHPETIGHLHALRDRAVGLVLAKAARAALFSRSDTTGLLLYGARGLLGAAEGETADRLRDAATRIEELTAGLAHDTTPARPLDRLAFAALRRDGERHPTTPEALRLWRDLDTDLTRDHRSLHHLAVAEHARAYQLDIDGDDRAFEYWHTALACWARLHGDPDFWTDLREHLAAVMPDASAAEVAAAVDSAAADLPANLLEPHISRILELHLDDSARARAHLDLLRDAPFAAHEVAAARARVSREAGARIRRLIREGALDRALDEARAWTAIDDDNVPLAELMLEVGIEHVESARQRGERWSTEARPTVERIAEVVEPIRATLGLTDRQIAARGRRTFTDPDHAAFAAKLARFEFWLGACQLMATYRDYQQSPFSDRSGFRTAAAHFHNAITLGLPAREPFARARELMVDAGRLQRAVQGQYVGFL
ncbi:hypothetical protein [Nocardia sp. NPDC050406]|uniref:hypothetical protein n=1 Tax=Nocardia sp. NPDC050406 TaxID=3364318 RepID=UPI0037AF9C40